MVAVCTIEKANAAVNRLVQEGRVHELCCVVVDEAHMVGDAQRGLPLELSLSKLMHAAAASQAAAAREAAHTARTQAATQQLQQQGQWAHAERQCAVAAAAGLGPQIVCMSATIGGLDAMCDWLHARLVRQRLLGLGSVGEAAAE
eukprot:365655-Chlamydomonas_euryale.AAC.16